MALARRLFALDVDSEWDILYDAPNRYADVLGDNGLAELKRLADERWEALSDAERASAERGHFDLVKMREHLAKAAGDVDARVELLVQDLSYPYDYVEIAEVLIEADRGDDALAWAERGLAAFEDSDHRMRGDSRLDDVALAGWSERGRSAEVDDLVWRRFSEAPPINRHVEARIPTPATHDDLIAGLAWDGRLDDAWAVADEHGASLSVWMEMAKASETDRPIDAARAYGRDVEGQLERKRYEAAVRPPRLHPHAVRAGR